MTSFFTWRTQSFDYTYITETGAVMRYIAGTKKGVLAAVIAPGISTCEDAKKEYYRNHEAFARSFNR